MERVTNNISNKEPNSRTKPYSPIVNSGPSTLNSIYTLSDILLHKYLDPRRRKVGVTMNGDKKKKSGYLNS